jgi:GNAT superfamily N-acetyltransferase
VTEIRFRPGREDDAPALAEILYDIWRDGYWRLVGLPIESRGLDWYREQVAPIWSGAVIAAGHSDAPVGFCACVGDLLDDLWVARGHQGRGIGRLLLTAGEERIAASGHAEARLECIAANAPARRFYERAGWRAVRDYEFDRIPGLPMVEYRKRLGGVP